MLPTINIAIIGDYPKYADWVLLPHTTICISQDTKLSTIVDTLTKIDLVIFAGGSDVSPHLYNSMPHITTHSDPARDQMETNYYKWFKSHNIQMIGICRGAQFLTVMNRGTLIQDVTGHGIMGTHEIYKDGELIGETTSTHHQMMYPFDIPHYMFAYSKPRSHYYVVSNQLSYEELPNLMEPEIVYYPHQQLAVQGHPEYMSHNSFLVHFLNMYLVLIFGLGQYLNLSEYLPLFRKLTLTAPQKYLLEDVRAIANPSTLNMFQHKTISAEQDPFDEEPEPEGVERPEVNLKEEDFGF